jgi:hypothetical protein
MSSYLKLFASLVPDIEKVVTILDDNEFRKLVNNTKNQSSKEVLDKFIKNTIYSTIDSHIHPILKIEYLNHIFLNDNVNNNDKVERYLFGAFIHWYARKDLKDIKLDIISKVSTAIKSLSKLVTTEIRSGKQLYIELVETISRSIVTEILNDDNNDSSSYISLFKLVNDILNYKPEYDDYKSISSPLNKSQNTINCPVILSSEDSCSTTEILNEIYHDMVELEKSLSKDINNSNTTNDNTTKENTSKDNRNDNIKFNVTDNNPINESLSDNRKDNILRLDVTDENPFDEFLSDNRKDNILRLDVRDDNPFDRSLLGNNFMKCRKRKCNRKVKFNLNKRQKK